MTPAPLVYTLFAAGVMANVLRINKKGVFLFVVLNCFTSALLFSWFKYSSYQMSLYAEEFDLGPIPYAKIDTCSFVQDCPDIRNRGNTTIRRSQLVLTRMLRLLQLITQKHGIKFFIYKGSVLGAARHKGVNPFDNDIDVAMIQEDYDKLSKVIQRELPSDTFFQTESTDPFYKKPRLSFMVAKLRDKKSCYPDYLRVCGDKCLQNGLQVDISVLQQNESGDFIDLFSSESYILRYLRGPLRLKKEDIFPLQNLEFEGFQMPVPNHWKKLLVFWYGKDYMTVPTPRERKLLSGTTVDPVHSCDEVKRNQKHHMVNSPK